MEDKALQSPYNANIGKKGVICEALTISAQFPARTHTHAGFSLKLRGFTTRVRFAFTCI